MSLLPIFARLSAEGVKSALFDGLFLCSYSDVDDIHSVDFQSANAGDVKKINNRIDSTQTQWVLPICAKIFWRSEICPLWRPLSLQLLMLMTGWCRFGKCLCRRCEKINNRVGSTQTRWACSLSVPDFCWGGEIYPLSLPMAQQLLMLMTWMVQICELLMQDM